MSKRDPQFRAGLDAVQLALQSRAGFDIPRRTRALLVTAGLAGAVVLIVECLVGDAPSTVEVDKILHFSGYATLALIFTLSLRPALYLPALAGLAVLGLVIEFVQPYTGRDFDLTDEVANLIGIGVGATAGILTRTAYAYLRTELAALDVRSRLLHFEPGEVILREGERLDQFYIIKDGVVEVSREVDGEPVPLTVLGPGDVLGILAVLQGTPQYTKATPRTRTAIYGMDLEQLMASAGGRELPVATVLKALAEQLRQAVEKLTELEAGQRAAKGQGVP